MAFLGSGRAKAASNGLALAQATALDIQTPDYNIFGPQELDLLPMIYARSGHPPFRFTGLLFWVRLIIFGHHCSLTSRRHSASVWQVSSILPAVCAFGFGLGFGASRHKGCLAEVGCHHMASLDSHHQRWMSIPQRQVWEISVERWG